MKRLLIAFFIILLLPIVSSHEDGEFAPCDPSANPDYAELIKTREIDKYMMYGFLIIGIIFVIMGKARYNPLKHQLEKKYTRACRAIFLIGVLFLLLGFHQHLKMHEYDADTLFFGFPGDAHEHADFAVYINNEKINFSNEKYMTTEDNIISKHAHLHDMDGNVAHKHASGVTWGYFFKTIGFEFTEDCFVLDSRESYCEDSENRLLFIVNGKTNSEYGSYELNDLDRVLISYGPVDAERIVQEFETVTDEACIYSGKCPERGDKSLSEGCLSS